MDIDPAEIRALIKSATQRTGAPVYDEDLEQDATLRAVEAFRKQCEVRHPRALLRKIVWDTVRDHWRRRRPVQDLDSLDETRFAQQPTFEDDLDRLRQVELLRRAMSQMERQTRATLHLFYAEDRSVAEIARMQKRSVSAVKMALLRARRSLAQIVRNLSQKKSL